MGMLVRNSGRLFYKTSELLYMEKRRHLEFSENFVELSQTIIMKCLLGYEIAQTFKMTLYLPSTVSV